MVVDSPRGFPGDRGAKRWLRMRLASHTARSLAGGWGVRAGEGSRLRLATCAREVTLGAPCAAGRS
jgi:hypothetical protein